MTQQELTSYRFSSGREPSDEMLDQLMENAARKVRESNHESDIRYFETLRRNCEAAKMNSSKSSDIHNPG